MSAHPLKARPIWVDFFKSGGPGLSGFEHLNIDMFIEEQGLPPRAKYKCKKNHYWLTVNPCETAIGVSVCKRLGYKAVGFGRAGPWSNAVFLSPWPYRPTAVEKGVIQPWAKEMIKREGF